MLTRACGLVRALASMSASHRIAVVSPFLDKRHGTERCIAEQVERLARDYGYEVHLYSRRVEDVRGVGTIRGRPELRGRNRGEGAEAQEHSGRGRIVWHRVPALPGPGVVKYLSWFAANHVVRWWDAIVGGAQYELLYSPGINCLDADAVAVHIVFAEFAERVGPELTLPQNPPTTWPRIIHRRLYYWLISLLERRVYPRRDLAIAAVSRKTAHDVARLYRRGGDVSLVYNGVDVEQFSPQIRNRLRARARRELDLPQDAFALALVGNDWKDKGLRCLLDAMEQLQEPCLSVLVVGRDDRTPFESRIRSMGLEGRVCFLPPRPDVEFYYAASDAYVAPSLEDSFALPPIEAMACGLPVIVSSRAGVSEIISDGVDGLILRDPRDAKELAGLIRGLVEDAELRRRLGAQAVHTVQKYTWERNAAETAAFLENAMRRRRRP